MDDRQLVLGSRGLFYNCHNTPLALVATPGPPILPAVVGYPQQNKDKCEKHVVKQIKGSVGVQYVCIVAPCFRAFRPERVLVFPAGSPLMSGRVSPLY